MKSEPLISVIVPAYNHEDYVTECLESLAAQTYPNMEVLVIDDGSKDGTKATIETFLQVTNRPVFSFVSRPNAGLCATLNEGLSKAKGDYIAFIASDDIWLPEKLSRQILYMEENPGTGLVFSDAYIMRGTKQTNEKWTDYKRMLRNFFYQGRALPGVYERLMIYTFIPALTVILRKSVLDTVGYFDERLAYEDDDMWLRFARKTDLAFIDEPLATYRMHATNISNSKYFMLKGYAQTIRKHLGEEPLKSRPLWAVKIILHAIFAIIISRIKKIILRNRNK